MERPAREIDAQPEPAAPLAASPLPAVSALGPASAAHTLAHGDGASKARMLLGMQRGAGNAAVARLLARQHAHTHHEDDPTLEWSEFEADAPADSAFDAMTFSGFETALSAPAVEVEQDGTKWKARVPFDPATFNTAQAFMDPTRSWVKEGHATDALLAHEQGHFDISNAIAEKTETAMEALLTAKGVGSWFTKSSKVAAQNAAIANWNKWSGTAHAGKIAKKGLKVQKKAQTDYDADPPVGSGHGTDAAKQAHWETEIAAGLPGYDVT